MSVIISSAITTSTPDAAVPLSHARILWKNLITSSTLSGTAGQTDFPLSAIINPATYERYKPASMPAQIDFNITPGVAVNAVGIAAHNLATLGCSIKIEYSTGGAYTTIDEFTVGGDDTPILSIFDTVEASQFRITITGTTPTIGVVYIGEALEMQRGIYGGHSPITLSRKTAVRPNVSETGQWLGARQERKGFAGSYAWQHLKAAWYRENFDPFAANNPRVNPFFIAWKPDIYPNEVGYCIAQNDIEPSNMGKKDFMSVSMDVEGFSD